jgi:nucleotide-binding universal stress UspA family protein
VPPPPTPSIGAPIDAERLKRDVEQEGDEILTSAVERVPDDVSVASRTRHGHPSGEILRQLEEEGHDLVVLGSRGRGRARANLLGSVAREVHYGTRVAMLVIHPDEGDA